MLLILENSNQLLHDVQISRIYPDSKTFVDKKLRYSESEILDKYYKFKQANKNLVPTSSALRQFIDENFEDGNELEEWTPTDFTVTPSIVNKIRDQDYKQWAYSLNSIWKTLARKTKIDVKTHPDNYSLIWMPNGFVIPGGRFRELYYWDTYWIVKGLLLCDMRNTARGIIDNVISMVNRFGFVPNGSRIYYLNRTQPPMLILMVLAYYQATNDFDYVKSVLTDLGSELNFWLKNRMFSFQKDGKTYKMARYNALSKGPRPESYREDYELAQTFCTKEEKAVFYGNIVSTAESGWDFSSRWFIMSNGSNCGDLVNNSTSKIIPVDLNSILHANASTLSVWYNRVGHIDVAGKYGAVACELLKCINEVLWRPDRGAWFDWDTANHKHREYFYVSNIVPLWTESYSAPKDTIANVVLGYLKDQNVIESNYGIKYNGTPTSMYSSTQQWDYPNAWPPLQAFVVQGLDRTRQKLAQRVAATMAEVWLRSNYKGFTEKSFMYEKYDVLASGETGGGGEYIPQTGFGWTNGVVLEFLDRWGDVASYKSDDTCIKKT